MAVQPLDVMGSQLPDPELPDKGEDILVGHLVVMGPGRLP